MKQITATEKLKAVNEGTFSKKEFVRQMRLEFPNHITQFNGFNDTVQILKNRGLLFEEKKKVEKPTKVDSYDNRPTLTYSLDALERGIRAELASLGITMPHEGVKSEDYFKAEKKAKENLEKNPNHYLDLISGESQKVDKNDKMKETKRGKEETDTFNGMQKVKLKESIKQTASDILSKFGHIEGINSLIKEYIQSNKTLIKESKIKDTVSDFSNFIEEKYNQSINEGRIKKSKGGKIVTENDYDTGGYVEAMGPKFDAAVDRLVRAFEEWKNGPMTEPGMIPHAKKDVVDYIDRSLDSYLEEEKGKDLDKDGAGPSRSDIRENKEMDDVYGDGDVVVDITGMSPGMKAVWEIEKEISEFGDSNDAQLVVDNMIEINSEEHLIYYLKERDIDTPTIVHMVKAYNSASISEKKGKDLDKDGDIDSDDYLMARDKAIEKAMGKEETLKEAVKKIILKTLSEQSLNEAATNELAKFAEDYAGFEGMKPAILALENIVTEIEAFYDKTRGKIQKVYDTLGEIRNEDGLKVGGFLAPSIENAFRRDLRPVTKKGFTEGLSQPKVKVLSQKDIDAHNSGEAPLEEEPKQNIFSPAN